MRNIHSYECGEFVHIGLEYPNLKKMNQRTSTWSDEDASDTEKIKEERSHICFLALEETIEVTYLTYNRCNDLQNLLYPAINNLI